MGWTLFACFGCTKKRKRPKRASKLGSKTRRVITKRIRGYEPLQSDIPKEVGVLEEPLSSPREKAKDEKKARIIKKVRFNLDVVTYEPLSSQEDEHDIDWEERGSEEIEKAAVNSCSLIYAPLSKTTATESKMPLYSANYRYSSTCYDGEDEYEDEEEEEDECQLTDDDDGDYDENDYDSDVDCIIDPQSIYCEQITGELPDCSSAPLIGSAANARLRSHYIVSVLNPIENLSQWKAVKTRKC